MRRAQFVGALLAILVLSAPAWQRRDPLTSAETDQLREVAQEPAKRLELYLRFIGNRIASLDKLRSDPRLEGERAAQIHDLLDGITILTDEMDDNIDTYAGRKADLRKPLRAVLTAESGFQQKLRQVQPSAASNSAQAAEAKSYSFVLQNALEAVSSSLDHARKLLDEQEASFKAEKQQRK